MKTADSKLARTSVAFLAALGSVGAAAATTFAVASPAKAANSDTGTITGTAFRDFNASGVMVTARTAADPALDVGVSGVVVDAYDSTGVEVGTATTAADGTYTLTFTGSASPTVRVEFTPPTGFDIGPVGTGTTGTESGGDVQFDADGGVANVGLVAPGDYCNANPTIVIPCIQGAINQVSTTAGGGGATLSPATLPALESLPYGSGGTAASSGTTQATVAQIGSVWGNATYNVDGGEYAFTAAYFKRHAELGPGSNGIPGGSTSLGAIYLTNLAAGSANGADWTTIPDAGLDPRLAYYGVASESDLTAAQWLDDTPGYENADEIGLGGMSLSSDESTLYVVNLSDNDLYAVPITPPTSAGGAPTAGTPVPIPLPVTLPGTTGCAGTVRPFAVQAEPTAVYVGLTCTGPTADDLGVFVYTMNPSTDAFSPAPVFQTTLGGYSRGYSYTNDAVPAAWNPWAGDTFEDTSAASGWANYPQPLLSSLSFDAYGNMTLGIKDRNGDQVGAETPAPGTTTPILEGVSAGDDLLACASSTTSWTLESDGSCASAIEGGTLTAGGTGNTGAFAAGVGDGIGPGGGEFYWQHYIAGSGTGGATAALVTGGTPAHPHTAEGGVAEVPGFADVVSSNFDPISAETGTNSYFQTGGVDLLSNTDGGNDSPGGGAIVYSANASDNQDTSAFAKANGLGDVAVLCTDAPVEIGSRVWLDSNDNGIQDPGEPGIAGATVTLETAGGTVLATTTTDANGNYTFSSTTVPGLTASTPYTVLVDTPGDFASGGVLNNDQPTTANAGTDTLDNSKGTPTGAIGASASVTAPSVGADLDVDFGFAPITQTIAADIYVCTNGMPSTTLAPATGAVLSAPTTPAVSGTNTIPPTEVTAGSVTLTGTAPTGYIFVPCGTTTATISADGTSASQPITVPQGGSATGAFYATPIVSGLTVVKSASPTTITGPAGSTITYTVTVTNTGNQPVSGLTITDTQANVGTTAPTFTCPVSTLAAAGQTDDSTACTATYTVTAADLSDGSIVDTAVATVTLPSGTTESASSSATVGVTQTIAANIFECVDGAPSTTLAPTAGASLSAPTTPAVSGTDTIPATSVDAGTVTVSGTAPTGYVFVPCGTTGSTISADGSAATQSVTVPSGGAATGVFYAAPITQTIAANIFECVDGVPSTTLAPATGASLSAPTTPAVSGTNEIPATSVDAGTVTLSGTAPTGYTFVPCGTTGSTISADGSTATQSVTVPSGGTETGVFYAAPITQTIAANIFECDNGAPSTTLVPAAGAALSAPTTPAVSGTNEIPTTDVDAGTVTLSGTAPTGYMFVACGSTVSTISADGSTATQPVTVPSGGAATGVFYATPITQTIAADIYICDAGTQTTTLAPDSASLSAPTTPAVSGSNQIVATDVDAGTVTLTGTAPTNYEFVPCGTTGSTISADGTSAMQPVTVPSGGAATGVFYVVLIPAPTVQTIAADIYVCDGGTPTTTLAPTTGAALSAPTTPAVSGTDTIPATSVDAGTVTVSGTAPTNYKFVPCGTTGSTINPAGTGATQSVTVPSGGAATGVFYVTPVVQTIAADIFECVDGVPTTTLAPTTGAALSAPTTPAVSGTNKIPTTDVDAGTVTLSGTAPTGYTFVPCGTTGSTISADGSTATQSVTVPSGGTETGVFYAAPITQTIAANIFECVDGAPSTTLVPAAGAALSAPTTPAVSGTNKISTTDVDAGTVTLSGTAPTGYTFVPCGTTVSTISGDGSSATQPVTVPSGGAATGVFYATPITQTIAGDIYVCLDGAVTTTLAPTAGAALAAPSTPAVSGTNEIPTTAVAAGTVTMTATAPTGYLFVSCGSTGVTIDGSGTGATRPVTVPAGGAGVGIFYVEKDAPALTVVKTASPTTITSVGETITFSFTVTNVGNVTITDVKVIDTQTASSGPLSTGPTCPGATSAGGPTLKPGQSIVCTASYVTTAADATRGYISDSAVATGTAPGGVSVVAPTAVAKVLAVSISRVPPTTTPPASSTPSSSSLPATGFDAAGAIRTALLLVGIGFGLVLTGRRRRVRRPRTATG